MGDVVGIGPHHALDLPVLEKLQRVVLEMKHDRGAARCLRSAGATVKLPLPSEDHMKASFSPARREITSTRLATMKAE